MPRFDNEGFNPNKRINNDGRDRSVPIDENYYAGGEFTLDSYDDNSGDIIDRQGNVDLYEYIDSFSAPRRSERQSANDFVPEVLRDYDAERRAQNEANARSRDRQPKPQRPKRRHKISFGKKLLLSVISIILVIVLAMTGMVNGVMGKITYDDKRDNQYIASSDLKSSAMVKNILLLGVDARKNDDDTKSRTDSMMLVSIDMKHKCIKMVSFLRDTWVYIPARDGEQRLNAACSTDGYNGVVDTIEYNFGVDIDGYVIADFEMFKVLVDSIGGVEVDVTEKEANEVTSHKKRYGNVKLESGKYKLTGEQALAYCRIRKIDTDFMRAKRQRTVMQSILGGVKSGNPLTLYKMARGAAPYIETNLTKSEIIKLGMCALPCLKGEMVETRVPFDGTWSYANKRGASVIDINADKNKDKLIEYIYSLSAEEIKAQEKD